MFRFLFSRNFHLCFFLFLPAFYAVPASYWTLHHKIINNLLTFGSCIVFFSIPFCTVPSLFFAHAKFQRNFKCVVLQTTRKNVFVCVLCRAMLLRFDCRLSFLFHNIVVQQISSMGFKSNGKPGRIYHWNLPVLKKMLTKAESTGRKSSNLRHSNDVNDLIDIKNIPTWSNPWDDNETFDKAFTGKQNRGNNADITGVSTVNINGIDDDLNLKLLKKKSPTYYAPTKQKKKAAMYDSAAKSSSSSSKYFPGNGKPKSFYVIKKNEHKPYYQELIP